MLFRTAAIGCLAGLTAAASAQSAGTIDLHAQWHDASGNGSLEFGERVTFDVYADFSGFNVFETLLVALLQVEVWGGATVDFSSGAPGAGLPIGDGASFFSFVSEGIDGNLVLTAYTNGGLLAFPLQSNPQDVHLFSFDVIYGGGDWRWGVPVALGPAGGQGFTTFDIATGGTTLHTPSWNIPAPGAASLATLAGLAALRRRRC